MSPSEAAIIVARFLKSNNYDETLDVFVREAGLPPTAGSTNKGDLTIEKILEEKRIFDVSLQFEKLGTDDGNQGWGLKAPSSPVEISGPSRSNILHVSVPGVVTSSDRSGPFLLATTADRRFNLHKLPACTLHASLLAIHDSPILSSVVLKRSHLLTTSMSGHLAIGNLQGDVSHRRRDHSKYVVQVASHETENATWVATAGWDAKVHLYKLDSTDNNSTPKLDAPIASITLATNPEAILFIKHPDDDQPVLIVTRRDSTHLFYYSVDEEFRLLGKQNLAPNSNSWIAFSPSAIALSPVDGTLVAVATSAIPHMKLLIVRLIVPSLDGQTPAISIATAGTETAAAQARTASALQDREAAAIQIHCTTMAPQTAYSTPALAWRADGSGIWVNSDDGVIRGIEAISGKVVATLKGHELGTKIRCLSTGIVEVEGSKQEWLASGGFDQKLIVWKPESSS